MRPPLREAAGIKSHDAIGFPQSLNDLSDQYLDQGPVIPERGANEVLQDLALDIHQRRDVLGILAGVSRTGDLPGRDTHCAYRSRSQARIDKAFRSRADGPP